MDLSGVRCFGSGREKTHRVKQYRAVALLPVDFLGGPKENLYGMGVRSIDRGGYA